MPELHRIMCVDDDADIRAILELALEEVGGMTTCMCGSGDEAIGSVGDFTPDLILLDVMMPGKDGPTVLRELRSDDGPGSRIPVIFLTAKIQPNEAASYLQSGALDVIAKPFDPMLLAAQVRQIWTRGAAT